MGRSEKLRTKPQAGSGTKLGTGKVPPGSSKGSSRAATDGADKVQPGQDDGQYGAGDSRVVRVGSATQAACSTVPPSPDPPVLTPGWADQLGAQLGADMRSAPVLRAYKRTDEQRFKMSMSQRARWAARKGQLSG